MASGLPKTANTAATSHASLELSKRGARRAGLGVPGSTFEAESVAETALKRLPGAAMGIGVGEAEWVGLVDGREAAAALVVLALVVAFVLGSLFAVASVPRGGSKNEGGLEMRFGGGASAF
eukprot:6202830-Pleurochrysis_carterae.AAC.3